MLDWLFPAKPRKAETRPLSGLKNETETLLPDPRKMPPWHLTGIVLCWRGKMTKSDYRLRERWDNIETGEVELRPITMLEDV